MAASVSHTDGSIGYVEYAYALQNRIPYALIRNHDGYYLHPSTESFMAAAAHADGKNGGAAPGLFWSV